MPPAKASRLGRILRLVRTGSQRAGTKRTGAGRTGTRRSTGKGSTAKRSGTRRTGAKRARTRSRPRRRAGGRTLALRVGRLLAIGLAVLVGLAFLAALGYVTLTPQPSARGQVVGNLDPGDSIRFYLDRPGVRTAIIEIGGNLVLLAPFGILLPVIFVSMRGAIRITAVCAAVSLCVETIQGTLIVGRAFDVDDVLLNTAGALLAYLFIGRRLSGYLHARRSR